MKESMIENVVIQTISELFEVEKTKFSLSSSFEDLKLEELDIVELVMVLEEKLNFSANDKIYYSKTIKELIIKEKADEEIQNQAEKEGMRTMLEDGFIKAAQRVTSLEEVLRVIREE